MNTKKTTRIAFEIMALILSLIVIIPLYFVLVNSFKTEKDAADMLISFTGKLNAIANYKIVLQKGNILNSFINSVVVTTLSVIIVAVISAMTGFVLQRRRGRYTRAFDFTILAGLIVPPAIVPTFWVLKLLHINGTRLSLILVEVAVMFSFCAISYKGFLKTIPRELDEASIVDGCGKFRLFFIIIFPLLKPVTITIIIVQGISIWNDFANPLYFLSGPESATMPLTVYMFFGRYVSSWNLVFADVVIIAIPVTIVYLFLQKQIIAGMTAGSLKG